MRGERFEPGAIGTVARDDEAPRIRAASGALRRGNFPTVVHGAGFVAVAPERARIVLAGRFNQRRHALSILQTPDVEQHRLDRAFARAGDKAFGFESVEENVARDAGDLFGRRCRSRTDRDAHLKTSSQRANHRRAIGHGGTVAAAVKGGHARELVGEERRPPQHRRKGFVEVDHVGTKG
jgi:hypothetical protein